MRFFRRSKDAPKIESKIDNHGLVDWWLSTFTEQERTYILTKFKPLIVGTTIPASHAVSSGDVDSGDDPTPLDQVINPDGSPAISFFGLATWFRSPQDRHIARRILEKSEELSAGNVLDRHFTYSEMIPIYYRDRNEDPEALDLAIRACEKQIELGPQASRAFQAEYPTQELPTHRGFTQLAIIREKERNYPEAINLAREALRQGWAGDWENRIARCEKRLAKS